jgi:hypothetical protein
MSTKRSKPNQDIAQALEMGTLRDDAHRELRAMLLSAHPCPPLPMIANTAEGSLRVFSSHDFLATAVDRMLLNPNILRDLERRESQLALCEKLAKDLEVVMRDSSYTGDNKTTANYDLLTSFSRNYVALYFEKARRCTLDIRFTPWQHVCRKDVTHLAACAHLRALHILMGEDVDTDQYNDFGYDAVINEFCRRTVMNKGMFSNFSEM